MAPWAAVTARNAARVACGVLSWWAVPATAASQAAGGDGMRTVPNGLAQLRGLERVLAMEVGAVDALSHLERARRAGSSASTWGSGFFGSARRMGQRLAVQLDGVEDAEDAHGAHAGMRCSQAAAMNRVADSASERARVCAFVAESCAPKAGFFNYLLVPYCGFPWAPWIGSVALLLFLAVLFLWLCAMVDFLIPALSTVSKLCMLRQSVAGVTFLAFGNGCSDIFSMTAATISGVKGMELAIGEVLGNGMLIFCGIQGIIAIITPFTASSSEYLRDCGFYMASLLLTTLVLYDGHMSGVEGGLFLALYALYVIVVVNFERVVAFLDLAPLEPEAMTSPVDATAANAAERDSLLRVSSTDAAAAASELGASAKAVCVHAMSVAPKRPRGMEWYELVAVVVQAPIVVLMNLSVPVVSDTLPKNGWSRPVATTQMLLLPLLVGLFVCTHVLPSDTPAGSWVLVMAVGLCVGCVMAVLLWVSTDTEEAPTWHMSLCFVGFAATVLYIYAAAAEIVNIILAFGVVFEIGNFSLGVSVLAIGELVSVYACRHVLLESAGLVFHVEGARDRGQGTATMCGCGWLGGCCMCEHACVCAGIGMQDLVSNIGVARAGFPNMAASACVGAPLLNILLGLGDSRNLSLSLPLSPCASSYVGCLFYASTHPPSI